MTPRIVSEIADLLRAPVPYVALRAPRGWGKTRIALLALERAGLWHLLESGGGTSREGSPYRILLPQGGLEGRIEDLRRTRPPVLMVDGLGPGPGPGGSDGALVHLADLMDEWLHGPEPPPPVLLLALPRVAGEGEALLSRARLLDLEERFRDDPALLGEALLWDHRWPLEGTLARDLGRLLLRSPKNLGPFRMGEKLLLRIGREGWDRNWDGVLRAYREEEGEEAGLFWRRGWQAGELLEALRDRVLGQEEALRTLARSLAMAYTPFHDPRRPRGVFLLLGPTGVGKTETAKALARVGFGSERYLVRFDMGEFAEGHSIYRFIGAPPGYVGYGQGELTQRLQEHPQCVLLLDEIEKAHPQVRQFLLALLDEGRVTDGQGRLVDAREAIILMTSNESEERLRTTFSREFLGRVRRVHYRSLGKEEVFRLVKGRLDEYARRLREEAKVELEPTDEALDRLAQEALAYQEGGVRALDRLLEDRLAEAGLDRVLAQGERGRFRLEVDQEGRFRLAREGWSWGFW